MGRLHLGYRLTPTPRSHQHWNYSSWVKVFFHCVWTVQSSSLQIQGIPHSVWSDSTDFQNSSLLAFTLITPAGVFVSRVWYLFLVCVSVIFSRTPEMVLVMGMGQQSITTISNRILPWIGAISALVFRLMILVRMAEVVWCPHSSSGVTIYKSNQSLTLKKTRE